MANPYIYLVWSLNSVVLVGQSNGTFIQSVSVDGITFPNSSTTPLTFSLSSSAQQNNTLDILNNVRLYLTGDPDQIAIVQGLWPTQGGGLQISYDSGQTYNTFSTTYGYAATSSTWALLPGISTGLNGTDGIIGPFDSANLTVQYVIPEQATQYQIYNNIAITADFTIT